MSMIEFDLKDISSENRVNLIPPSGIEPELPASEANALSVTPRGQVNLYVDCIKSSYQKQ